MAELPNQLRSGPGSLSSQEVAKTVPMLSYVPRLTKVAERPNNLAREAQLRWCSLPACETEHCGRALRLKGAEQADLESAESLLPNYLGEALCSLWLRRGTAFAVGSFVSYREIVINTASSCHALVSHS